MKGLLILLTLGCLLERGNTAYIQRKVKHVITLKYLYRSKCTQCYGTSSKLSLCSLYMFQIKKKIIYIIVTLKVLYLNEFLTIHISLR